LYVSVEQVAARHDVLKDTIWRWVREGEFPKPIKIGMKCSRWRLSELEAYEQQCGTCFATSLIGWSPEEPMRGVERPELV